MGPWPSCSQCKRPAIYWSGGVRYTFSGALLTKMEADFYCGGHVPNPDKYFELTPRDWEALGHCPYGCERMACDGSER